MLGDLEVMFQEQLEALARDAAEQQMAKKGKAIFVDNELARPCQQLDPPSIMVLEELEATPMTRPVELITPQLGGRCEYLTLEIQTGEGPKERGLHGGAAKRETEDKEKRSRHLIY